VPNVFVAQIVLDRPRVVAVAGELVACGMPQHVSMNLKRELGLLAGTLHQPIKALGGGWAAALGYEYKWPHSFLTELP
jgi:hypothetical protein